VVGATALKIVPKERVTITVAFENLKLSELLES